MSSGGFCRWADNPHEKASGDRLALQWQWRVALKGTVDDRQMEHVNQVGHLSKTQLNLLEIYKIGLVDLYIWI